MLPCVCSVIDHRRRQNVVRTSMTHSAVASCATFLFSSHFGVICDLLLKTKSMCTLWLVNQLWFIVLVNPSKNRASSELLYKSNRPQVSMVYLTNRFHVAVHLSSNRSQRTSKCGENISDTLGYLECHFFVLTTF